MNVSSAKDYWESRLAEQCGLHGVGFLGLGRYYNAWLCKVRGKVFRRMMKPAQLDFHSVTVLDVGSGTGFYIEKWRELGVRSIVGIDLTQASTEHLRQKYPEHEFFQLDMGASISPLAGRLFDVVSAFDVLFHIVDDQQYATAINNVHCLLKQGGLFVFSENFLHLERRGSSHQVSRRLETIERVLAGAGFETLTRSPMFCLMNAPVDSSSVALHVFWRVISTIVSRSELAGLVIGGFLFPIESLLVRFVRESPTTEIMVCKKSDS